MRLIRRLLGRGVQDVVVRHHAPLAVDWTSATTRWRQQAVGAAGHLRQHVVRPQADLVHAARPIVADGDEQVVLDVEQLAEPVTLLHRRSVGVDQARQLVVLRLGGRHDTGHGGREAGTGDGEAQDAPPVGLRPDDKVAQRRGRAAWVDRGHSSAGGWNGEVRHNVPTSC